MKETLQDYLLVFDAVYIPRKTRLLKEAEAAGAITVSGVEMFLRQAIGQFNLFTNKEGQFDIVSQTSVKSKNEKKKFQFSTVLILTNVTSFTLAFLYCRSKRIYARNHFS